MKYSVKKIADILGISISTIRNYEKMGVISPERQKNNNYRKYDAVDANIIRRVRYYTGLGLGIKEASDMILHGSVEDLAAEFGLACTKTWDKIRLEELRYCFFAEKQTHLNRIVPMINRCCIENSPPMFAIQYRKGNVFYDDEKILATVK